MSSWSPFDDGVKFFLKCTDFYFLGYSVSFLLDLETKVDFMYALAKTC